MAEYYQALQLLAEAAGEYGDNTYSVRAYALGFIPFKNGSNMTKEVGVKFTEVAKWLIDEGERNFNQNVYGEQSDMSSVSEYAVYDEFLSACNGKRLLEVFTTGSQETHLQMQRTFNEKKIKYLAYSNKIIGNYEIRFSIQ